MNFSFAAVQHGAMYGADAYEASTKCCGAQNFLCLIMTPCNARANTQACVVEET
jgi:hypothetical protein